MPVPEGYEPVTFLNSQGEEITNDPVLLAQRQIDAITGVDSTRRDDSEDEIGDEEKPVSQMSGDELKAYAKEHNIDISGLRKVGQVRDRITEVLTDRAEEEESGEATDPTTPEDES